MTPLRINPLLTQYHWLTFRSHWRHYSKTHPQCLGLVRMLKARSIFLAQHVNDRFGHRALLSAARCLVESFVRSVHRRKNGVAGVQPLFRTHDARYMVYWRTTTPAAYPAVLKEIEARERERQALEARTLDQVMPGEQQPEVDHLLEGEDLATGIHLGRRWRDAGGWLAYRLKAPAGSGPLELMLTFFGGDKNDGFELLANEREIATIQLKGDRPDDFINLTFALPPDLAVTARQDGIAVKLVALGKRTSRIFGVRLLRARNRAL
jgi:hypothetical protein